MTESRRVLLCIGCDAYDDATLGALNGAEKDARNVFSLLTDAGFGEYDLATSVLLLSPTLTEVISAIDSLLLAFDEPADTFTLFFAGHGGISNATYYLCLKDTVLGRLATTACSLSRVFEIINERPPAQCNIILDSCQSGGLVHDLGALLKPELLGKANTSGVSIFATSAADEYSTDTRDGGLGTVQLLKVLRGEVVVQTQHPFLDLVEVGRIASELILRESEELAASGSAGGIASQNPVVWGMNLFGQSRFSKNPLFDSSKPASLFELTAISPRAQAAEAIKKSAQSIWALYYSPPDALTPSAIRDVLRPIVNAMADEHDVTNFVSGISTTLAARAVDSDDSFARVRVLACCISLLLQYCGKSGVAEGVILKLGAQLADALRNELSAFYKDLCANPKCLAFEGLSDFFYLPLRISNIFAWIGALFCFEDLLGRDSSDIKAELKDLTEKLIETYQQNVVFVSDEQASLGFIFLYAAQKYGMGEEGERVFGNLASSFFRANGFVARPMLNLSKVYDFVRRQVSNDFAEAYDMVASPTESLSVILMAARFYKLEDTLDPYLRELDHAAHFAFLPANHIDFGQEVIQLGRNHNFQIGQGVWRCEDFWKRWEEVCLPQLSSDKSLSNVAVRLAALCSSLSFPDRTPWFLTLEQVRF